MVLETMLMNINS